MLASDLSALSCLLLGQYMVSFQRNEGMCVELDLKRIGKRFRNVRKMTGLTQEAFGEALNLSKNHISDIERGCSLTHLPALVSVSNTNISLFIDYLILP